MYTAKLSSKYQMLIPKELRELLNLQAGQYFLLIPKGNTLQVVPKLAAKAVKGMLAGSDTSNYRDRSDRI